MPEVDKTSEAIRSQYFGQDRGVNIQKEINERKRIEDGKLDGVEFRDKPKQLDRDDFLKLLVKQLTTQDPTAPVQDQQFIAQMAQFSALEQMKNMADGFQSMSNRQAVNLVGKFVIGKDFTSGESISGIAQALFFDSAGQPFLKVGGRAMTVKDIEMVGDPSMIKPEFGGTSQTQAAQPQAAPGHAPAITVPQSSQEIPTSSMKQPQVAPGPAQAPANKTEAIPPASDSKSKSAPAEKPQPVTLRGGYGEWVLPNLEFIG
ncbi:MAG: hypothetical protein K8S54_10215 [Spirochaetia bacterium]|nr:hypothetical protein [Spirochaetia bacterium]